MPDIRNAFEQDNEYVKLYEENRKLKMENSIIKNKMDEYVRTIHSHRRMIDRLQEAVVNQALLMAYAMEWDDEAEQD